MYSVCMRILCMRVCKGLDERQKILQMHSESPNDKWRNSVLFQVLTI